MKTADKKEKAFTIRVTLEQYEEIANLAAENNRSVSGEIVESIKDARVYRNLPSPLLPQKLQRDIAECALGFILTEGGIPPENVNGLSMKLIAKRLVKGSIALDVFIPAFIAAALVSLFVLLGYWFM